MSDNTSNENNEDMEDMNVGFVRFLHAVPGAPNVDLYANNNFVMDNFAYGEYTDYFMVPEGSYELALYVTRMDTTSDMDDDSENGDSPVAYNMLKVKKNAMITVAAIGTPDDIELLAITDADSPMVPGKAMVRFLHLSPNAPAVDITLPDGTVLLGDVGYREITPYMDVPPMDYTLQVRVANTPNVVLTVPNLKFEADQYYTVAAIGLVGESPELQALLLTDGIE